MTGVERQILACLRKVDSAGPVDIAQRLAVSTDFVRSVMDGLAEEGRIVRANGGEYALSPSEKERPERYTRLEARRKPFVKW